MSDVSNISIASRSCCRCGSYATNSCEGQTTNCCSRVPRQSLQDGNVLRQRRIQVRTVRNGVCRSIREQVILVSRGFDTRSLITCWVRLSKPSERNHDHLSEEGMRVIHGVKQ